MPSPIAHAVTGYCLGLAWFTAPIHGVASFRTKRTLTLIGTLSAVAADLDFLPQLFSNLSFHRGISHSLGMGILCCFFLAFFCRSSRRAFFSAAALGFLSYGLHLFMDLLTKGGRGTPVFWPLSSQTVEIPFDIFPQVHHSEGFLYSGHIPVLIFETAYASLVLWLTYLGVRFYQSFKKSKMLEKSTFDGGGLPSE